MTISIPIAFSQKFTADFLLLSQQKMSRLWKTVRSEPDFLNGKFGYYDRIGATAMQRRTSRNADTPNIDQAHSRRRITLSDYEWATLIDKQDVMRMIAGGMLPAKYLQNALMAAQRQRDDVIIAAATANSQVMDEDDAATSTALPAAQIIANGGTGLTLAKVLNAKELLDAAEVAEETPKYAIVSAKQVTNMLNTTEVKSVDYNSVKALASGQLNTFLGFEWIRSERLAVSSSIRKCLFYAQGAVGVALGEDITTDIGPRRDKGMATQVYVSQSLDATRVEDVQLVEVDCSEA